MVSLQTTCSSCGNNKPTAEFYPDRRRENGLYASCKMCSRLIAKRWRQRNKKKISSWIKRWREKNIKRVLEYSRSYREKNKDQVRVRLEKWRLRSRKYLKEYSRKYNKTNRKRLNKYVREKARDDIQYRLARQLRSRFADALRGRQRSASAVSNLGCTLLEFKTYLSKLWAVGMAWENWGRGPGKWHIDHILPLGFFDLAIPDQQKLACHYTNLQPLWEKDNLSKSGPRRKKVGCMKQNSSYDKAHNIARRLEDSLRHANLGNQPR